MTLRCSAVVLRTYDFSESSQTAELFTRRHGKVRVIAKGIKKKSRAFEGALDLLDLGEAAWLERRNRQGLCILTEWRRMESFAGLRADLDAYYAGLYLAELTDGLTEDFDPHPALFDGLVAALRRLGGAGSAAAVLTCQLLLLREVGLAPVLDECVHCGRAAAPRAPTYFGADSGGLICRDCEPHVVDKRRITPAALAALRAFSRPGAEPAAPAEPVLRELSRTLRDYFSYHLGHEPRTARFAAPRARSHLD
jgi:DNA repair protein RecO (recombination protein O)